MRLKVLLLSFFISLGGFAQYANHAYTFALDNFPGVYGGKSEWKRFLHDHMVYPKTELAEKAEGTVLIAFVVTKEGKSENAKVVESVTTAIDNEALRLLSLIEWFPSSQDGIEVNVDHSVEINFSVSKYKKYVKERGFEKALFTDMPLDSSLTIYEAAEKGAVFFDPDKTFQEFISSNLEYPDVARQQGLEGNVVLSFVIEPDGMLSNIRIKNAGIGGGCNEEAIRVISKTKWKPAIRNGKYVRFRMNYTMTFSLKNSFKDNSGGTQRPFGQ